MVGRPLLAFCLDFQQPLGLGRSALAAGLALLRRRLARTMGLSSQYLSLLIDLITQDQHPRQTWKSVNGSCKELHFEIFVLVFIFWF